MEDGKPLGPAHAVHEDIRTKGRGAYSHWTADLLYFSASDNGDPRKNGRAYTLVGRFRGLRRPPWSPDRALRFLSDPVGRRGCGQPPPHPPQSGPPRGRLPRLRERGSPDLGSKEAMIGSIIEPGMTPERKSIAIWTFLMDRSYHYWPARGDAELHDPVKFLNVYGYGLCDDAAENFTALCEAAGLRAQRAGAQRARRGGVVLRRELAYVRPRYAVLLPRGRRACAGRRGAGEGPRRHHRRAGDALRLSPARRSPGSTPPRPTTACIPRGRPGRATASNPSSSPATR